MPYKDSEKRKEYHREYSRKWEAVNREKRNERLRLWRAAHPDVAKASGRRSAMTCNWYNLQPLWKTDNRSKGDR